MHHTRRMWLLLLLLGLCSLAVTAALGADNNPNIRLRYVPQQAIAGDRADLPASVRETPLRLTLTDGRGEEDPRTIGTRTDDDDNLHELRSTNDVLPFVTQVLIDNAKLWGVRVRDDADLRLSGELLRFKVYEQNQAVGATYKAEVQVSFDMTDASGKTLWSGRSYGDASRYGRKFSADNANEVLSDALKEAFATMFNDPRLQKAWSSKRGTQSTAPAAPAAASETPRTSPPAAGRDKPAKPAEALTPAGLLSEVQSLKAQGFSDATLVDFVRQQTLTRKLTADDLATWKAAGVGEPVIREAMRCEVAG